MTRFLVVLLLATATFATTNSALQTIYIGSFGQTDDAERLRMLLVDHLTSAGFTPVKDASSADAILSGILTVHHVGTGTEARVTAVLTDKTGKPVWRGDYGSSFHPGNDAVKWRANDITKALRKLRK